MSEKDAQTTCGIEECKKLIPIFNPSAEGSMCAKDWLSNIDTIKNMFKWSDRATLFYAALRLEEAASSWFTATKHNNLTWIEFKTSLVQAFPAAEDNGQLYVKLMQRTKNKSESIEKYFYDVLTIARQGGFNDEAAKKFIVSGLDDKELIAAVTGSITQTNSVHELLTQIKVHLNIIEQQRTRAKFTHRGSMYPEQVSSRIVKPYPIQNCKRVEARTCFKCREVGHIARDCRKPNLFRMNNYDNGPAAKIARLSVNKSNDLIKTAIIEDKHMSAFLDLGSECSTIKMAKLDENKWKFEHCYMKLVGFGGTAVFAMGKINKLVEVQNVPISIDIFVVNNKDQEYDMIIGQNFLDSPGVRCIRENGKFNIEYTRPTSA